MPNHQLWVAKKNTTLQKKHIENQSSAIFAGFFQGGNKISNKHPPFTLFTLKVLQSPLTRIASSFQLSTKPNFDAFEKSADQVGTCDPKVIASPLGSKDSWSTTSNQRPQPDAPVMGS